MKKAQKKSKEALINDMTALRAFVMPDLFPFLLDIYVREGKTEEILREDIKKARESYKELVTASKQK